MKASAPEQSIFRAYDIRGIVPATLNPEVAYQIGQAVGSEARERSISAISVGYDGRLSSPDLSDALIRGLLASGVDVCAVGALPTPALYYSATELTQGSGVMVTGSHNPIDYNGCKIMLGGHTLSGDEITGLYQRIAEGRLEPGNGTLRSRNIGENYLQRLQSDLSPIKPLRVAVDCGNGIPGPWIVELLQQLNCRVIPLYCDVDGEFPNHHPDPEKPENLKDLMDAVRTEQADIGLALDGDGDRLVVIDEKGTVVTPDQLISLFTEQLLQQQPGARIVYDVKTSLRVPQLIRQLGGEADIWKCGHSMIKNRMRATDAIFGGEFSGHLFFADRWYGFDDGLYAAIRLLELLSQTDKPASALFAKYPPLPSTPMINIPQTEQGKFQLIEQLSKIKFPGATITCIDGLRVEFSDGWFGIRASNTTPLLTLRVEALTLQALTRISTTLYQTLKQLSPDLQIPELAVTNDTQLENRDISHATDT